MATYSRIANEIINEVKKKVSEGEKSIEIHYSEVINKFNININVARTTLMVVAQRLKNEGINARYEKGKLKIET